MYKLTLNDINEIIEATIDKREIAVNDSLYVMHNASALISLAVWGSDNFPKTTPILRLRPLTEEEKDKKLIDDTNEYINSMRVLVDALKRKAEKEKR